jgi:hypothetical protein
VRKLLRIKILISTSRLRKLSGAIHTRCKLANDNQEWQRDAHPGPWMSVSERTVDRLAEPAKMIKEQKREGESTSDSDTVVTMWATLYCV